MINHDLTGPQLTFSVSGYLSTELNHDQQRVLIGSEDFELQSLDI